MLPNDNLLFSFHSLSLSLCVAKTTCEMRSFILQLAGGERVREAGWHLKDVCIFVRAY